jgi:selT/selW/selH-like putative selenoprotein
MQRNFVDAKRYLEGEFPGIHVDGENYPIPPLIELLLKVLQGVQLLAMALIVFGDGVWTNILRLRSVPSFYYKIKEYSFQVGILIFFVLPQILNKYIITGAFEMVLDGVTVYSKLETGRMPNAVDLVAPLQAIGLLKASQ